MYKIFAVYMAVFAATFWGVELFRRWSLRREILDIPNERSSHTVPTPRGGGLIIFLVSVFALLVYTFAAGVDFYWGFFAGAGIVAIISLIDDVHTISPFLRFLFHSLSAGLAIWSFGGFETVWIPFYGKIQTGLVGDILAIFWIIWLINAYNFMDGIDGIAAMQAVTAGAGWGFAGWLWENEFVTFWGAVLAFSSLGFLLLNWQPAKIFMGDVGSAFLGYSFAVLPLLTKKLMPDSDIVPNLVWIAIIFVWFFVFDSVFTLFRRLFRGEKIWRPHREHIYQKLVISGVPHSRVTLIYGALSIIAVLAAATAIKYSLNLGLAVLVVVSLETVLLIVLWRKIGSLKGKQC